MSTSTFHVIIIGGGLGGLCLAQGLKKAEISVAVYERDRTPSDRLQGYRIHIEPQGNQALSACLPADLFKTYLATSGSAGAGYRICTEQLKPLIFFPAPASITDANPAKLSRSVSRITLRQLLLSGLDKIVNFNKSFTHYQEAPDGKITAFFEDGTSATGDVLVAADGGNSLVRKQFLPHAQRVETGAVAIMGKLALTEEVRSLLLPGQLDGATSILGPQGRALFVAIHDRGNQPRAHRDAGDGTNDAAIQLHPGLLYDNLSDYLFWALIARQEKYPLQEDPRQMDRPALQQVVTSMIQDWHPRLQQLIRMSDASTIICKPLHTTTPFKHWETKHVTLLGDAIHSMPPTRGIGGNTALRDAQLLCQQFIAAQAGEKSLLQSIHAYEVEMMKYGFAAVRGSIRALDLHVSNTRLMTKIMLRTINVLMTLAKPMNIINLPAYRHRLSRPRRS